MVTTSDQPEQVLEQETDQGSGMLVTLADFRIFFWSGEQRESLVDSYAGERH
jgi:hypothetical protein